MTLFVLSSCEKRVSDERGRGKNRKSETDDRQTEGKRISTRDWRAENNTKRDMGEERLFKKGSPDRPE